MTSTNDGKNVKHNQSSGPKGKLYFIELYKYLDSHLSGEGSLQERTQHLCKAWISIHSLCLHSAPDIHAHLLSWLQTHTARTILQTEWQNPESKSDHGKLDSAIETLIKECQAAKAARNGPAPLWESRLLARAKWYRSVLSNPWEHSVLRLLSNPTGEKPSDREVLEWLKEERSEMFTTRLRQLATSKACTDIATALATAIMDRCRASITDQEHTKDFAKIKEPSFGDVLRTEAGFTSEVWELLTDLEFVLLFKGDNQPRCIELAKKMTLRTGYRLVDRLSVRSEKFPREKKLWKNANEVAKLIAQVIITRCMVSPVCAGAVCTALQRCSVVLARLLPPARLPPTASALAALAATAVHLHTLATAVGEQCKEEMKPFVCELYVRAITTGMNELERLKIKTETHAEARSTEQMLSTWFTQLGKLLSKSTRLDYECALTAFSVHPSRTMFERIIAAPTLPPLASCTESQESTAEANSEFGSWATDSRTKTNFVKTSETLNIKQTQHNANVLSTAVLTLGEAIGLEAELCQDLAVLLSGPRHKTLSWDMNRDILLENCKTYMERTHSGTRALTTELKYLNLDPRSFQHLPMEKDDEDSIYYGIEKGYEHLVESQETAHIWEDEVTDTATEGSFSSDMFDLDSSPVRRKKKKSKRIRYSTDEEIDPLGSLSDIQYEKKKERPHSKERSKEKLKPKVTESRQGKESEQVKIKSEKKEKKNERKERKKREKGYAVCEPTAGGSLSRLIGMKVARVENLPVKLENQSNAHINCTDQRKLSIASINSDGSETNVVFDGLYSMDEIEVPEKNNQNCELAANKTTVLNPIHIESDGKTKDSLLSQVTVIEAKNIQKTVNITQINPPLPKPIHASQNTCSQESKSIDIQAKEVNGEFKQNIKKLIEFRRVKHHANNDVKVVSQLPSSNENYLTDNVNAALPLNPLQDVKELKITIPSNTSSQIVQSNATKVNINKKQCEQLNSLGSEASSLLTSNKSVTPKSPHPFEKSYVGRVVFGLAQYTGSIHGQKLKESNPERQPTAQFESQHAYNTFNKKTSDNAKVIADKPVLVRNNLCENSTHLNSNNKISYKHFVNELKATINAGAIRDKLGKGQNVLQNDTNASTYKTWTNAFNDKFKIQSVFTPQCAKTLIQQKKADAPNTFSRLSYMHKNKHSDIKPKHAVCQTKQIKPKKTSTELDKQTVELKLNKYQYLQNSDLTISRIKNATQPRKCKDNPAILRKHQKSSLCGKSSTFSKEHPRLASILRANLNKISNKKNSLDTCEEIVNDAHKNEPLGGTNPNTKPTSTSSMLMEKDQQDILQLLRQQNRLNSSSPILKPTIKLKHIASLSPPCKLECSNITLNVPSDFRDFGSADATRLTGCEAYRNKSHEPYVAENISVMTQRDHLISPAIKIPTTAIKIVNSPLHALSKSDASGCKKLCDRKCESKTLIKKEKFTQKHSSANSIPEQDWKMVMEDLLKHKTPSRGPNALDIALNRDSFNKPKKVENIPSQENSELKSKGGDKVNVIREDATNVEYKKVISSDSSSNASPIHSNLPKRLNQPVVVQKSNMYHIPKSLLPNQSKKDTASNVLKNHDPFISGIPKSDYDLLDELMDDDLRQEIGELFSDEESFSSTNRKENQSSFDKGKTLSVPPFHKSYIDSLSISKEQEMQSTCSTNQDSSKFANDGEKVLNTISMQLTKSRMCSTVIDNHNHLIIPSHTKVTTDAKDTRNIVITDAHDIRQDKNSLITVVKQNASTSHSPSPNNGVYRYNTVPQLQNVLVVSSEVAYNTYPVKMQIQENQSTNLCYINPNVGNVAVNNTIPNISLLHTIPFVTPLVKSEVFGKASTDFELQNKSEQSSVTRAAENRSEVNFNNLTTSKQQREPIGFLKHQTKKINDTVISNFQNRMTDQDTRSEIVKDSIKNHDRNKLPQIEDNNKLVYIKSGQMLSLNSEPHIDVNTKFKFAMNNERLKQKRLDIMNRQVNHYSSIMPIPLPYLSLTKGETKIEENDNLCKNSDEELKQRHDNVEIALHSVGNVKKVCENISSDNYSKHQCTRVENCDDGKNDLKTDLKGSGKKESNDSVDLPCRRIFLRSSKKDKIITLSQKPQVVKSKQKLRLTVLKHENVLKGIDGNSPRTPKKGTKESTNEEYDLATHNLIDKVTESITIEENVKVINKEKNHTVLRKTDKIIPVISTPSSIDTQLLTKKDQLIGSERIGLETNGENENCTNENILIHVNSDFDTSQIKDNSNEQTSTKSDNVMYRDKWQKAIVENKSKELNYNTDKKNTQKNYINKLPVVNKSDLHEDCKLRKHTIVNYSSSKKQHSICNEIKDLDEVKFKEITSSKMLKDPSKKTYSVRLPNGSKFKAIITGLNDFDINSSILHGEIKLILLNNYYNNINLANINISKTCKILQPSTMAKITKEIETINLISDDEEDSPILKTELGTFVIGALDKEEFSKHEKKLSNKCYVPLTRYTVEQLTALGGNKKVTIDVKESPNYSLLKDTTSNTETLAHSINLLPLCIKNDLEDNKNIRDFNINCTLVDKTTNLLNTQNSIIKPSEIALDEVKFVLPKTSLVEIEKNVPKTKKCVQNYFVTAQGLPQSVNRSECSLKLIRCDNLVKEYEKLKVMKQKCYVKLIRCDSDFNKKINRAHAFEVMETFTNKQKQPEKLYNDNITNIPREDGRDCNLDNDLINSNNITIKDNVKLKSGERSISCSLLKKIPTFERTINTTNKEPNIINKVNNKNDDDPIENYVKHNIDDIKVQNPNSNDCNIDNNIRHNNLGIKNIVKAKLDRPMSCPILDNCSIYENVTDLTNEALQAMNNVKNCNDDGQKPNQNINDCIIDNEIFHQNDSQNEDIVKPKLERSSSCSILDDFSLCEDVLNLTNDAPKLIVTQTQLNNFNDDGQKPTEILTVFHNCHSEWSMSKRDLFLQSTKNLAGCMYKVDSNNRYSQIIADISTDFEDQTKHSSFREVNSTKVVNVIPSHIFRNFQVESLKKLVLNFFEYKTMLYALHPALQRSENTQVAGSLKRKLLFIDNSSCKMHKHDHEIPLRETIETSTIIEVKPKTALDNIYKVKSEPDSVNTENDSSLTVSNNTANTSEHSLIENGSNLTTSLEAIETSTIIEVKPKTALDNIYKVKSEPDSVNTENDSSLTVSNNTANTSEHSLIENGSNLTTSLEAEITNMNKQTYLDPKCIEKGQNLSNYLDTSGLIKVENKESNLFIDDDFFKLKEEEINDLNPININHATNHSDAKGLYKSEDMCDVSQKSDAKTNISTNRHFVSLDLSENNTFYVDMDHDYVKKRISLNDNNDTGSESNLECNVRVKLENDNVIENLVTDEEERTYNILRNLTLFYKSDLVLKGIEYEDPIAGTCYMFPLETDGIDYENYFCDENRGELVNDGNEMQKSSHSINYDFNEENISMIIPKKTYSRFDKVEKERYFDKYSKKNIKLELKFPERETIFRNSENIDYVEQKISADDCTAYKKEFKCLINYHSSLKFSYSRPFHKEYIDATSLVKAWPIKDSYHVPSATEVEDIFQDNYKQECVIDPTKQTLAEELSADYKDFELTSNETEENDLHTGFGEESGRVIQNLEKKDEYPKFSAATLSDVKQSQPFLLSEDYKDRENTFERSNLSREDQRNKLKRYLTYIEIRDKVRSFFNKTSMELNCKWMMDNTKDKDSRKVKEQFDSPNYPFDFNSYHFLESRPSETIVQVVPSGQPPVSATAQNPASCGTCVTQVSDIPSQYTVVNSPHNDLQSDIKTEYTELTTDLSLPLGEYKRQNYNKERQEPSYIPNNNRIVQSEFEFCAKIEPKEEKCDDEENKSLENKDKDSYYPNVKNKSLESDTPVSFYHSTNKEIYRSERIYQKAHAMTAACITTENYPEAHQFGEVLPLKVPQNLHNTTKSSESDCSNTTSINAASLQDALAHILRPQMNQTISAENNDQSDNTSVTPQVLHIVHGKNGPSNHVTHVENIQQSVINSPNSTPVLNIVKNKDSTANETPVQHMNTNGTPVQLQNSLGSLSLVGTRLQQGGNRFLHIVNAGNHEVANAKQFLKKVNLLTNLTEKKDDYPKFSAATLSDVKQSQPFLQSEGYKDRENTFETSNLSRDDQRNKLKRYFTYIEIRNKVRSFFKKTSMELNYNWKMDNAKDKDSRKVKDQYDSPNYPFDFYSYHFFEPPPSETIVQVVQIGQQPVSAAAQNPVSCDPRVTQVSDSPSQCTVVNSPHDDLQTDIKTEYTELTTADLSLPLGEYKRQNYNKERQEPSYIPNNKEIVQSEFEFCAKIEPKEEKGDDEEKKSPENKDSDYSYDQNVNNKAFELDTPASLFYDSTNKEIERIDQIAHAMNAAGITSENNPEAHEFGDVLPLKVPQNLHNTKKSSESDCSNTTSINAAALQHALAQILPPQMNQIISAENNDQSHNTSVTPQVLHIVHEKNVTGNHVTHVENVQQSVINSPNSTPVLNIVKNKDSTANETPVQHTNSLGGPTFVDTGLQQGENQFLHIVNAGNHKDANANQLLKRVNLLTNLANVQGSNEQNMLQFVCKSTDGKAIQLNTHHQSSMVLRLPPIESQSFQDISSNPEYLSLTPSIANNANVQETTMAQQEINSRSVYEENYAKLIQNTSNEQCSPERTTSLPKFNQAFGKPVFQDENQKENELDSNTSHLSPVHASAAHPECETHDNAMNLDHIGQIDSPPLLIRKSPQTSQAQSNLVQQIKQSIAPMNIQTMHGGVIYTRQIPVNIGGGQTINLITVPSTDLTEESNHKQADGKFQMNHNDIIEPSIIKIIPQTQSTPSSEVAPEESNNNVGILNENGQNAQPQPVLTQMRIKLPMLSKTPQMVAGARVVRPSFFQIQRNVIGGVNQPVYQQLVLTAAPPLGQQTIRLPQSQVNKEIKMPTETQSTTENQMSSSTLEQLREFDMVLEQVKERSTVQPNSIANSSVPKPHTTATETNEAASIKPASEATQVLYSIGTNQHFNVAYVNKKSTATTPTTSTFTRSPNSSVITESPTSSTPVKSSQTAPTVKSTNGTSTLQTPPKSSKSSSRSRPRTKASSNPPSTLKFNSSSSKSSSQKPHEDEQTTQRILYILAEYREQVENCPDKNKPAPRRRTNLPFTPGSSKRKKSGSSRSGGRDSSPGNADDVYRNAGSEDSSCGASQGDCNENSLETQSPEQSPRKTGRKLSFENETPPAQPKPPPQRNVIVADGQIALTRGAPGKPTTALLMPANYILPVSMLKGGQQIAIVTNRGPKLLTVSGGEGGTTSALLLQRLIGPAGLKPMLARTGVRHIRLPTTLHNLQAFNLATATAAPPPDSTVSPAPAPTPDLVETENKAPESPWTERDDQNPKPVRCSSPEGKQPWTVASSANPNDGTYQEPARTENVERTVLEPIPDRYSPDLEAQRIFDKMFDVDSKRSYVDGTQDDSPRCGFDINTSDCDDKCYHQVVQKRDVPSHRQHRHNHVTSAALRHKYAALEQELRLQKSLSEECEDLGVDSPSAAELFPEADLLFSGSPATEPAQPQEQNFHRSHTPQPIIINQSMPRPDTEDQVATDHLLQRRDLQYEHHQLAMNLGLDDVGIVTVTEDGATITLDHEEFARSHPNTTFHREPSEDGEVHPYTISGIRSRHTTIFHASRAPATVLMGPQTTVISQASHDSPHIQHNIRYSHVENVINSPVIHHQQFHNPPTVLVKDDGLTRYDTILTDSRELHLSHTASAIVHSVGNATQVIRRVGYDDERRAPRYLMDDTLVGDDARTMTYESSRDAAFESIAGDVDYDRSSPERHAELYWESNSASERSDGRRPLDFSSDSDKCCKSPSYDETNSTDSSGIGSHVRLDSVIKDARGLDRSGSADGSSADDTHPPLRTYPPKRVYHGEMGRSLTGKTRAGERLTDSLDGRRRASGRGVVKRCCHCCTGSPLPPRPKKPRQRKPAPIDYSIH